MNQRELAGRILLFSALGVWLGFIGLFEHYSYTRPTVENPSAGRTHVQNNHGHHTYLTAEENFRLNALQVGAGVLALIGAILASSRTKI